MDAVTRNVLRMLEDDTIGAPDAKKVNPGGIASEFIAETKELPIGDVSGKVKGPGLTGGGIEKDSFDDQAPPEAKKVKPPLMTDEMLRMLPNAIGRMARMGGETEP